MDKTGNFQNVPVENTYGVGVCEHKTRGIGTQDLFQSLQVHTAIGIGRDVYDLVAAHGCGGGIGAVGRVRDDDLGPAVIAPGIVILLDQQYPCKFTVGTGGRLEGHIVHTRDLAQKLRCRFQNLLTAFGGMSRGQRMDACKAGQRRHLLIDPGIIFHGAGA